MIIDNAELIHNIIQNCRKCSYIDKPPCKYKIYHRYLPKQLHTLVISESPPPGRKNDYIYNLNRSDRLRNTLAKAFGVKQDEVIETLIKHNIFWTTAIKCRPWSKRGLEYMRRNCISILQHEIELLKPKKIIALGRTAWKSISELNITGIKIQRYYHPLYVIRFRRNELFILKNIILDNEI